MKPTKRRISATTCQHLIYLLLTLTSFSAAATAAAAVASSSSFDYESHEQEPEQVPVNSLELVATASSAGSVQCEPISLKLCAHLAYKSTRMPNFFRDSSQVEASERSFHYESLVSSKCSQHLHAYICELLTPVCLQDGHEVMRRFEIYPCRSFCRRVKRDCEPEISRHEAHLFREYGGGASLLPAFACDQLPFESNGGNGTLQGPCHDAPEMQGPSAGSNLQQQTGGGSQKSSYRPYQPQLDENVPPYITDTSRLDAKFVLPAVKFPPELEAPKDPSQANRPESDNKTKQVNITSQLHSWTQSVLWTVARYSNYISVFSVLLLLIALNSKRLSRLRRHLPCSPGSSSAKSSSASSQQGKLIGGARQISPSSSSRSLMLIAGNSKQPASHQLVTGGGSMGELSEPSQKLLHGLNQQRTLINVNGTLERQQQLNRYLIMQSDKQQLFNTLDSHSSSNQYDYIAVPPEQVAANRARQQQQQQQLYSNILLSSPGHQVLLYNGSQTSANYPAASGRPPRGAPPSPSTRNAAQYYTSSLASPFAASSSPRYNVSEAGGSERSFQRAARKGSSRGQPALQPGYVSAASTSGSSSGSSAGHSPASSAGSAPKALLLSQQRQQR